MSKRYYITTAISYPNGTPHIGHAYEALATDAIARFKRLDGYDVKFLTGTDEHGLKMDKTAREAGITPAELADRNAPRFQDMVKVLGCSNDDFIRTTEERHHEASQAIWQRMQDAGDIYKDSYAGWYSVRDEAYYGDEETHLNDDGVRLGPQGTPPGLLRGRVVTTHPMVVFSPGLASVFIRGVASGCPSVEPNPPNSAFSSKGAARKCGPSPT
jgi:methionyl-tRNA synthetase